MTGHERGTQTMRVPATMGPIDILVGAAFMPPAPGSRPTADIRPGSVTRRPFPPGATQARGEARAARKAWARRHCAQKNAHRGAAKPPWYDIRTELFLEWCFLRDILDVTALIAQVDKDWDTSAGIEGDIWA